MEDVVLKPNWSDFNTENSKIISGFFDAENVNNNQKFFSLELLRDYYRNDRILGSNLIDELSLRGYVFQSKKPSSFLPKCYISTKYITSNSNSHDSYKKINFDIIGLGNIIQKFNISDDSFFDYIPIEGFLTINKFSSLFLIENEFRNAGFNIETVKNDISFGILDIIRLNELNKIEKSLSNIDIDDVKSFCLNLNTIISNTPYLNKYDVIKLNLINNWFDNNYNIKDFRNILISDYFDFHNARFERYCNKKDYKKVTDLLCDKSVRNIDKTVTVYLDVFASYLRIFYYLNLDEKISNINISLIDELKKLNVVDILHEYEIITFRDLLKADLHSISQFGNTKVSNIKSVIYYLVRDPFQITIGNNLIPEILSNVRISDFFCESGVQSFIDYCNEHGFIYINDLKDVDLSSTLKKIKMLGRTKSHKILDKLTNKKYDVQSTYSLIDILFDDAKTDNLDLYSVLYERIVKHKTLEEIGNERDVSRERIRQLEAKAYRVFGSISNVIFDLVMLNEMIPCFDIEKIHSIFEDTDASEIMFNVFKSKDGFFYFESAHKIFILYFFNNCDDFVRDIQLVLNGDSEYCKKIMSIDDLNDALNVVINKYKLDNWITPADFSEVINTNFRQLGSVFMNKGVYTHDVFLDILKEYFPDGITFNEESCQLMRQKYFELTNERTDISVRNLNAKLQREKQVILRGPNTYIHIDNVKIDQRLIDVIKKYILHVFNNENLPSVYSDRIYNVFKDELNNYGIDNYSYLYGILRYYFPDDFEYQNFWITKSGNKEITRDIALIDYLKKDSNYNEGIPKERIISLFGLSGPFLINLIFNNNEIHECHNKENLIYCENYRLSEKLLNRIKEYIKQNIDLQYGYISIKHLLLKFNIYFEEEKIIDEFTLSNALKKYLSDYYIKDLYICKNKTQDILDEYFFFDLYLNNNKVITRKAFELYAEEKGINSGRTYDVLKNRFDDLYQLNISDFTKNISLEKDILFEIYSIIDYNMNAKQYLPLSLLKKNGSLYNMPNIGYSWNEYLLRTILIKNPNQKYKIIDIPGPMLYSEKGILVKSDLNVNDYISLLLYIYNKNNYYLLESVNQLYKEFQSLGVINDKLPNEFKKIVVDEYGRLRRC